MLTVSLMAAVSVKAAETEAIVDKWFAAQGKVHTWAAPFTQTRTLKVLAQPLTSTGRVWFSAPNRFHWELGDPVQTIAVRQAEQMLVIYPLLKRVERYPLSGNQAGPWKDALTLLETGFPQNRKELEARFKIVSEKDVAGNHELLLQPKSAAARKMMPQIKIGFSLTDLSLTLTELTFTDGSIFRNDFGKAEINGTIDPALFEPVIGPDYKVTEPLGKK